MKHTFVPVLKWHDNELIVPTMTGTFGTTEKASAWEPDILDLLVMRLADIEVAGRVDDLRSRIKGVPARIGPFECIYVAGPIWDSFDALPNADRKRDKGYAIVMTDDEGDNIILAYNSLLADTADEAYKNMNSGVFDSVLRSKHVVSHRAEYLDFTNIPHKGAILAGMKCAILQPVEEV